MLDTELFSFRFSSNQSQKFVKHPYGILCFRDEFDKLPRWVLLFHLVCLPCHYAQYVSQKYPTGVILSATYFCEYFCMFLHSVGCVYFSGSFPNVCLKYLPSLSPFPSPW